VLANTASYPRGGVHDKPPTYGNVVACWSATIGVDAQLGLLLTRHNRERTVKLLHRCHGRSVMTLKTVDQDIEALTVTIVAEFPVPLWRLWDAYVDPRQLERFWGPPERPATFIRHDVRPGGRSVYYMTGSDGARAGGYWEFLDVQAPQFFEVRDGFTHDDGTPDPDLPTMRVTFDFTELAAGSRLTTTTYFTSAQELEQLLGMGMLEGTRAAMEQIDGVVTDDASFAAHHIAQLQHLDDTSVRISRVFRAPIQEVWRAHHDPQLIQRWMLGPEGWVMPVCEPAQDPGDVYRYEWETTAGEDRFGFTGELLESFPPHRQVVTESMIGVEGPGTTNEMQLVEVRDGTLLTTVIHYPSVQLQDQILATGMVNGMEASYARLESNLIT